MLITENEPNWHIDFPEALLAAPPGDEEEQADQIEELRGELRDVYAELRRQRQAAQAKEDAIEALEQRILGAETMATYSARVAWLAVAVCGWFLAQGHVPH